MLRPYIAPANRPWFLFPRVSGMPFTIDFEPLREAAFSHEDPKILDGRAVAKAYREEVSKGVAILREQGGIIPKLVVVLAGDDPASEVYVRHKVRACGVLGIDSERRLLPQTTTAPLLSATLKQLNEDPTVNGILLQLPLPNDLDGVSAIEEIDPTKDVDGFHHVNLGRLMLRSSAIEPCTPRGVMMMLHARGIELRGKRAVVVGRSMIVGRPMTQMLVRADATVTVCHRHTVDLEHHVNEADVLVVATGVPELVKGDWIKEGAVVVDVGTTRVDGRLVGDVEFGLARERASAITPVPGGVGPMTVASLMDNTLRATLLSNGLYIEEGELREAKPKH